MQKLWKIYKSCLDHKLTYLLFKLHQNSYSGSVWWSETESEIFFEICIKTTKLGANTHFGITKGHERFWKCLNSTKIFISHPIVMEFGIY